MTGTCSTLLWTPRPKSWCWIYCSSLQLTRWKHPKIPCNIPVVRSNFSLWPWCLYNHGTGTYQFFRFGPSPNSCCRRPMGPVDPRRSKCLGVTPSNFNHLSHPLNYSIQNSTTQISCPPRQQLPSSRTLRQERLLSPPTLWMHPFGPLRNQKPTVDYCAVKKASTIPSCGSPIYLKLEFSRWVWFSSLAGSHWS